MILAPIGTIFKDGVSIIFICRTSNLNIHVIIYQFKYLLFNKKIKDNIYIYIYIYIYILNDIYHIRVKLSFLLTMLKSLWFSETCVQIYVKPIEIKWKI